MKAYINKVISCVVILMITASVNLFAQQESSEDGEVLMYQEYTNDQGQKVIEKIVKKNGATINTLTIDGERVDMNVELDEETVFDLQSLESLSSLEGLADLESLSDIDLSGLDDLSALSFNMNDCDDKDVNIFRVDRGNSNKPFLGVVMGERSENVGEGQLNSRSVSDQGVPVMKVVKGSAAEKAGLQKGDLVTRVNGTRINNHADIVKQIRASEVGDDMVIEYIRDGRAGQLTAKLGERQNTNTYRYNYKSYKQERPCVFIGITTSSGHHSGGAKGNKILRVLEGTPAVEAGLQRGDRVIALDGVDVNTYKELLTERDKHSPGEQVQITYVRDGKILSSSLTFDSCGEEEEETLFPESEPTEQAPLINATPQQALALENFSAFPNPAMDYVTLNFNGDAEALSLQLIDADGKELYREELPNFDGNYNKNVQLDQVPDGSFLLVVNQGGKVFTRQLVKVNSGSGPRP